MAEFEELGGYPKESLSEASGSAVERMFMCAWEDRVATAKLLGKTAYPHLDNARVVAIKMEPFTEDRIPEGTIVDPSTATATYGGQPCLITVSYGPDFASKIWPTDMPKPALRFGTEVRFQISGTGKFIQVPSSAAKWEDDETVPVPEDVNAGILIPLARISLQWDFVDDPPIDRLESLIGKINNGVFLGRAAETILFENYDVSETFRDSPDEMHTHRVGLDFSVRSIPTGGGTVGWNHDYREQPAGWAKLLLSDGNPRYKTDDFSGILT
jgi:hypothetical protein